MTAILTWLASLLTGPLLKAGLDAYKEKLAAGTTHDKLAEDLATKELLVQQKEIEAQNQLRIAQIGKWYEVEHLFGYTLWVYFSKCIIWDKVLAPWTHGSTDPLGGDISSWSGLIILFYFGKRGVENVVRIWKSKD